MYWINKAIKGDRAKPINLTKKDIKFIKPFLIEGKKKSNIFKNSLSTQIFFIKGCKLILEQGQWGVCIGTYPSGIAIETTGYKESIYHEFLHLFQVGDGYNVITKKTYYGCKNCWMQWDATKGQGLCKKHRLELSQFIDKIRNVG